MPRSAQSIERGSYWRSIYFAALVLQRMVFLARQSTHATNLIVRKGKTLVPYYGAHWYLIMVHPQTPLQRDCEEQTYSTVAHAVEFFAACAAASANKWKLEAQGVSTVRR